MKTNLSNAAYGSVIDDSPNGEVFKKSELINVRDKSSLCIVRENGEFKWKGFFLDISFNWSIVKDGEGCLVLVPTKK